MYATFPICFLMLMRLVNIVCFIKRRLLNKEAIAQESWSLWWNFWEKFQTSFLKKGGREIRRRSIMYVCCSTREREPDQNQMTVDVRDFSPSVWLMFIVLFQKLTNFLNFEIFDHISLKVSAAKYFKQQNREFFYATVYLLIFILYISSLLRTFSFS